MATEGDYRPHTALLAKADEPLGERGAREKTIAELKGEFALDVVPTKH